MRRANKLFCHQLYCKAHVLRYDRYVSGPYANAAVIERLQDNFQSEPSETRV